MARRDARNRARYWTDPRLAGVELLRAAYTTLTFAPHVHDELVIAVTEAGAGRFVSGRTAGGVAPPREVLVFNPGVPHAGGVLDARGWSYRALYLDRSGMAGLGREMFEGEGVVPHFSSNTLPDAALAATLLAAHGALEAGPPGGLADGILAQALLHLLARYADPRPRLLALGQERRPIARAVELLRASLAEPVTVAELARCAGMSQAHFIRAFKREIGLPPHRYLTLLRLRQARRLLAAGTGAADAAVSVGFYDQSHLTRLFKRTYGITPVQYATGAAAAADG